MSDISFPEYVQGVERLLNVVTATGEAATTSLKIDQRSLRLGFIAGAIEFSDGTELYFREYINLALTEPRLVYAYHYQDKEKTLIFRYDNARHKPALSELEHLHTPEGVVSAQPPTLNNILAEILKRLAM